MVGKDNSQLDMHYRTPKTLELVVSDISGYRDLNMGLVDSLFRKWSDLHIYSTFPNLSRRLEIYSWSG